MNCIVGHRVPMPRSIDYVCSNKDDPNPYKRCTDTRDSTLKISKYGKFSGAKLICGHCFLTKTWYKDKDYEVITKNDYSMLLPKPKEMDTDANEQVLLCLLVVYVWVYIFNSFYLCCYRFV